MTSTPSPSPDSASTSPSARPCDGTCSLPARRSTEAHGKRCEHFDDIRKVEPRADGCEECLAEGRAWTELRVCLTCGHVGCCEDSSGRHALHHHESTGHPMICSYERLETWGWCYPHHRYYDPMPMALPQRPYVWQAWWSRLFGRRPAPSSTRDDAA